MNVKHKGSSKLCFGLLLPIVYLCVRRLCIVALVDYIPIDDLP